MVIVRVLRSVEDEVNVALYIPLLFGGLVYGTKVGVSPVCAIQMQLLLCRNICYGLEAI